jgi:Fe-S cluster biosynthesis and repair protein YggX
MRQKDRLLEDLGLAIEELQRASMLLEILKHLVEVGDTHYDHFVQARWAALLIQQSLVVNETAVDFLEPWPERLDPQECPL